MLNIFIPRDRELLKVFLKQFSIVELQEFYEFLHKVFLKKYGNSPAIVTEPAKELDLENESFEQSNLFEVDGMVLGRSKVMVDLQLLKECSDEQLNDKIEALLSDLREYFFEGEKIRVALCGKGDKNELDLLKKVAALLIQRNIRVNYTLCD